MKMIILILVVFNCFVKGGFAQEISPETLGFDVNSIITEDLDEVRYYSTGDLDHPILLYLDGSGAFPLFQYTSKGIGSTVVIDWQKLKESYRIILISKPGIPFIDSIQYTPQGFPFYQATDYYEIMLSADWRINAADLVVNQEINKKIINKRVVVLGFSEGAQVAANLAAKNKYVTHLMLFSGNGIDQLFSEVINQRIQAERGQISHKNAQYNIDSLFQVYDEIWKTPRDVNNSWYGHTFQRWSSFSKSTPLEALLKLQIPIYFAVGSRDNHPILSADYVKFQFLKHGKTNLTYRVYPDHDHMFNYIQFSAENEPIINSNLNSILSDGFLWLEENF